MVLTAGSFVSVAALGERVDASRRAQISVGLVTSTVHDLEAAPFSADPAFNPASDAPAARLRTLVAAKIRADEQRISTAFSAAERTGAPASIVEEGRSSMVLVKPAVARVYELASAPGGLSAAGASKVAAAQVALSQRLQGVASAFASLDRADANGAARARLQAEAGTAIAMFTLLAVFVFFYFRSQRLAREIRDLLGLSRQEASTDALTGLGNRRALTDEISKVLTRQRTGAGELLVVMFDLDGFKQYNDSFGHGAGDKLLAGLGARLSAAAAGAAGTATAYRMGGDEFCMLAWCTPDSAESVLDAAVTALSEDGEGWKIGCSHGAVWVPSEAATPSEALQSADVRMYANKASRSSTGTQIAAALLQVLSEQDQGVNTHGGRVAELATEVAQALHLSGVDVQRIRLAATLHDIGKTAIPAAVLDKPGPLNDVEWGFLHQHTLIGERIVAAAPALAGTAPLIRSSHEQVDGGGYPDSLRGEQIPLGSRIIAVCDAFDAMTTDRSYRRAGTVDAALAELQRCAGTQFDPRVVDCLRDVVLTRQPAGQAIDLTRR